MNRRDFLSVVSSAGLGASLAGGLALGSGLSSSDLEGGTIGFSHFRQGMGYPVKVTLTLPSVASLDGPLRLLVIREAAVDWVDQVGEIQPDLEASGPNTWQWEWIPEVVRPTDRELEDEIIRYRLVALDDSGRSVGLVSRPLEVVCAGRGWGC